MPLHREGFSQFLHQRRVAISRKWKDILSDAYLSRATLHRIRHGDAHHPIAEVDSLRALAHALQFNSWNDLTAAFDAGDPRAGLDSAVPPHPYPGPASFRQATATDQEDALVALSKALNLTPTELARRLAAGGQSQSRSQPGGALAPPGLRINEMQPAQLAPHFQIGIAASELVEKLEDEDHESRQPVSTPDIRIFTIPVDGDCQEPVWKDGELVVFSFDAYEREGIVPGKSYYLAFTDGSTTFKRVFIDSLDHDYYLLKCWNTGRYPAERRVHFSNVVRIARAIAKQVNPEDQPK